MEKNVKRQGRESGFLPPKKQTTIILKIRNAAEFRIYSI